MESGGLGGLVVDECQLAPCVPSEVLRVPESRRGNGVELEDKDEVGEGEKKERKKEEKKHTGCKKSFALSKHHPCPALVCPPACEWLCFFFPSRPVSSLFLFCSVFFLSQHIARVPL